MQHASGQAQQGSIFFLGVIMCPREGRRRCEDDSSRSPTAAPTTVGRMRIPSHDSNAIACGCECVRVGGAYVEGHILDHRIVQHSGAPTVRSSHELRCLTVALRQSSHRCQQQKPRAMRQHLCDKNPDTMCQQPPPGRYMHPNPTERSERPPWSTKKDEQNL